MSRLLDEPEVYGMDGEPQLWMGEADRITGAFYWDKGDGWRLKIRSREGHETWSTPEEACAVPTGSYEQLTIRELLDVLSAEAIRRRGF